MPPEAPRVPPSPSSLQVLSDSPLLLPQAYLQFQTEEEAHSMAHFYSSNVTASVCGRPVRISHSSTYPTIQVTHSSSTSIQVRAPRPLQSIM